MAASDDAVTVRLLSINVSMATLQAAEIQSDVRWPEGPLNTSEQFA